MFRIIIGNVTLVEKYLKNVYLIRRSSLKYIPPTKIVYTLLVTRKPLLIIVVEMSKL